MTENRPRFHDVHDPDVHGLEEDCLEALDEECERVAEALAEMTTLAAMYRTDEFYNVLNDLYPPELVELYDKQEEEYIEDNSGNAIE